VTGDATAPTYAAREPTGQLRRRATLPGGSRSAGATRSGRARELGRGAAATRHTWRIAFVPSDRHLLRAKDLADARYSEPLSVDDLARAAGLSRAHFSREFRRAFGESPHAYLLTRRLERAAALLRNTDRSVTDICLAVGLESVGSFTTSFTRTYGRSPSAYRAAFPPAAQHARIPSCILRAYGRPSVVRAQQRTFREDTPLVRD